MSTTVVSERRTRSRAAGVRDSAFSVRCSTCFGSYPPDELQAHICLEHLEYFPYICGHCGHFFATDDLANYHVNKKKHFPVKIREHPEMQKEKQLEQLMKASGVQETQSGAVLAWERWKEQKLVKATDAVETQRAEECRQEQQLDAAGAAQKQPRIQRTREQRQLEQQMADVPSAMESLAGAENGACGICKVVPTTRGKMTHAKSHFQHQNNFACRHCDFTGKSAGSVRMHNNWRHKTEKAKDGVRRKRTLEEMYEFCFGVSSEEHERDSDSEEPPPKRHRPLTGRKIKKLVCQECGLVVGNNMVSFHIFQSHIQQGDMLKCGHCDYGSQYYPRKIELHSCVKHHGLPISIIDRRQNPDVQQIYKDWRQRCFPQPTASNPNAVRSSLERDGQTERREQPEMAPPFSQEQDEPYVEEVWCSKCLVAVLKREAEDHIWYTHLGGVLPYQCGLCLRSFLTLASMKQHWTGDHTHHFGQTMEIDVVPNDAAKAQFDQETAACFPEFRASFTVIKAEY